VVGAQGEPNADQDEHAPDHDLRRRHLVDCWDRPGEECGAERDEATEDETADVLPASLLFASDLSTCLTASWAASSLR
jgi:hypothetical protein